NFLSRVLSKAYSFYRLPLMSFLSRLRLGKARVCYGDLPDDVIRMLISFLDRETLLSLMATSKTMRDRIVSFRISIPRRVIRQFTISVRQRDLRLCTREDPAICRVRAKADSQSIDMLLTCRTAVFLRPSLIGLVGTPKKIPPMQPLDEILGDIVRYSKMDLENVRFLSDTKPFRFQFLQEDIDRRKVRFNYTYLF
ncbi:hypothetical protein PMAYCL1PPCAC_15694, partial [Pristionchus mayeri]